MSEFVSVSSKSRQSKPGCLDLALKIITAISVLAVVFIIFNRQTIRESFEEARNKFLTARTAEMNALGTWPEATGEKEITFRWQYQNREYTLAETLYDSYYNFYANSAKGYKYVGDLGQDWQEKYYQRFLDGAKEDQLLEKIAQDIREKGAANQLSEDEIVELTLAFVQAIPYDETRGQAVINNDASIAMQFPYETLYRQTGICGDKSFLAAKLVQELGYGTALFAFNQEKHMAVGIQCDSQYANYQSGYCYAETTNPGFKVGMIPDIDPKTSQSIALKKIGDFGTVSSQFDAQKLSTPVITNGTEGKIYEQIGQTIATSQKLDKLMVNLQSLNKTLTQKQSAIQTAENNLKSEESQLKKLAKDSKVEKYFDLYADYLKDYQGYQEQVKSYNEQVKKYNSQVKEYNAWLEKFIND